MSHGDEIDFLERVRVAAGRRLGECEHEARLAEDVGRRSGTDGDTERRRRKLLLRAERYRGLVLRLETDVRGVRHARLREIESEDRPAVLERARRLHHRARRLGEALERTREQYRGLQMRHLALDREERDLAERLGRGLPAGGEPPEIRSGLGDFRPDGAA